MPTNTQTNREQIIMTTTYITAQPTHDITKAESEPRLTQMHFYKPGSTSLAQPAALMGEEIKQQQMVGESQKSQTAPYQSQCHCVCVFPEDLFMTKDFSRILNVIAVKALHLQCRKLRCSEGEKQRARLTL